jgi:hypothetical protein
MALERLVDRAPWTIDHLPGNGSDLVLAFASVGHDPDRAPAPEFLRLASAGGRPALFIMDAARSWASAPGFAEALLAALNIVRSRQAVARILALGASMGGFAALCAAQVVPVDAVLAIGPQHRPAAPQECRWRRWTAALPQDLTAPLPGSGWTILMHALGDDAAQALAFPRRAGVDHILFGGLDHSALAPHLKARGGLDGMIAAALAGDRRRLLRIAAAAGGRRRVDA